MTVCINVRKRGHQALGFSSVQCCQLPQCEPNWALVGGRMLPAGSSAWCSLFVASLEEIVEDENEDGRRLFLLFEIALPALGFSIISASPVNVSYLNSFPQISILKQKKGG